MHMKDLNDPVQKTATARPRRRWLSALLYLLAAVALALGYLAYYIYDQKKGPPLPPRVTIDEQAVIDSVMTQTYGKYSAARKGWLYVAADRRTYLMRVVQQAKIPDGADGDELYFVASGAAADGRDGSAYGAFYVHPTQPRDGGLTHMNTQVVSRTAPAVKPGQVRFEALGKNLRGWVIEVRSGSDRTHSPVSTTSTVLAPHDGAIVRLGTFRTAMDYDPGKPCAQVKADWDAYVAYETPTDVEEDIEEPEEVLRCDGRRWSYRIGSATGANPAPITVTAGGTQDGLPVAARTWKLTFDPHSFAYDVPAELGEWAQ